MVARVMLEVVMRLVFIAMLVVLNLIVYPIAIAALESLE